MELTCSRCHQTVQPGDTFCPFCGLPQLVYNAEGTAGPGEPERWGQAVGDASSVDWKQAMRLAPMLALPAGVLCTAVAGVGLGGILLMPLAALWVVALYMRNQRPAWITIGAGARIGLVTGILGSWAATLTAGFTLYANRYWLHKGNAFDDMWQNQINMACQQLANLGFDAQQVATQRALMLSPQGRAGSELFDTTLAALILLAFAVGGGALGARLLGRPRRTRS